MKKKLLIAVMLIMLGVSLVGWGFGDKFVDKDRTTLENTETWAPNTDLKGLVAILPKGTVTVYNYDGSILLESGMVEIREASMFYVVFRTYGALMTRIPYTIVSGLPYIIEYTID